MGLEGIRLGYAVTGSFCTLSRSFNIMKQLVDMGASVVPIMSNVVFETDTRFGKATDFIKQAEEICNRPVMHKITETETIGPQKLLDALIVAPCTSNTLGKLANGINDTPVTMAVKATMRNEKPVIIAVSTNDGLSGSAKNIGMLLNCKNYYFVPFEQDDFVKKPSSTIANFDMIIPTVISALNGVQMQPVLYK